MKTSQIPNLVKEMLEYVEGKSFEEKLTLLLVRDLENRLRSCTERLYEFEKKYGQVFREFKEAWVEDKVPGKYSYEIERDYMEWESLDDEHNLLLSQMRKVKEESSSEAIS
jgi:hypothetical protein